MLETEVKFTVDPGRAAAVAQALANAGASTASVESRYHDTPDRRLASAGLSLRLRKAHGHWEQTLKAPGQNAMSREEETAPRAGNWGPLGPPVDPRLHAGTRAGHALLAALRRGHRDSSGPTTVAVLPTFISDVQRSTLLVSTADAAIEIAFDRGELRAGASTAPICELEYELKHGSPQALAELARAGIVQHGMWLSTLPKSARGDRLLHGCAVSPAVKAHAPTLPAHLPAAALMQAVLKTCLNQVLPNASELAAGRCDDDLVHQLRVGLRRLRTITHELSGVAGTPASGWGAPLAEAFRALGSWRDQRSIAPHLQVQLARAGSPAPALRRNPQATDDPGAVVRAPQFQCVLLDIVAFTLQPPHPGATDTAGKLRSSIAKRLRKLHAHLQRSVARFDDLDDAGRHQVRKRLKRLRYLAELTGPLFKRARVRRYLNALKPAQDALGASMDLAVGLQMARGAAGAAPRSGAAGAAPRSGAAGAASRSGAAGAAPWSGAAGAAAEPGAWFNVGWLTAEQAAAVRQCRKALRRAAQAQPFWTGTRA